MGVGGSLEEIMGRSSLGRLFSVIGGFLALYSLSIWIVTQGGAAVSALPGLDSRAPVVSAYFAIVIIGVALGIVALAGAAHARLPRGPDDMTLPLVGLGDKPDVKAGSCSAKAYVAGVLVVCVLIPAATLVHLNDKVAGHGWIWNETLPAGTAIPVGCVLPYWPFGSCGAGFLTAREYVLGAKELKEGDVGNQQGRLWIANHRCDPIWDRGMAGPQVIERKRLQQSLVTYDEAEARSTLGKRGEEPSRLLRSLAGLSDLAAAPTDLCSGKRDRSDICKADEARCRGVEWIRGASTFAVVASSLFGWLGTIWLVIALLLGPLRSTTESQPP
jgi:hypothetical protein